MSDQLMVPQAQSKYATPAVTQQFSQASSFLPRIQVSSGMSAIVTDSKIGVGRIAFVDGQNVIDFGLKAVALILAWRPKALRYEEGSAVAAYNPESPLFIEIRDSALLGGTNNPNQFGPEFLLWFPEHGRLASFFHGNITLRNEAPIGLGIFQKQCNESKWVPTIFEIDLIKSKKTGKQWHTTRISEYNSPIPEDKMPDMSVVGPEIEKFNNPKEGDPKEKAEETSSGRD